jgi:hypothetical protein
MKFKKKKKNHTLYTGPVVVEYACEDYLEFVSNCHQ